VLEALVVGFVVVIIVSFFLWWLVGPIFLRNLKCQRTDFALPVTSVVLKKFT
jgi:hypothetical protein